MDTELVALLISAGVGLVVPWLTELVTHLNAPTWVKSLVAAVLAALTGAIATVAVDPAGTPLDYLAAIGTAWLTSGRAYLAGLVARPLPTSGLGSPTPQAPQG